MSRWFRVYEDMVDDPKVQRLSAELFRLLINLWCLTSKNGGNLPCLGDMAYTLRLRTDRLQKMLGELTACGLIESGDNPRPHNWDKRQYKSDTSNERVKQHRERQRNVTAAVTVTPPEADTEQRQNTETEPEARLPASLKKLGNGICEDVKRKAPPHGATGKGRIWISASSQDWTIYAEDYLRAHGEYPKPEEDRGGKWFKVCGEQRATG